MDSIFDLLVALLEVILLILTISAESPILGPLLVLVAIVALLFYGDSSWPEDDDDL
jgi:hypothetical protein